MLSFFKKKPKETIPNAEIVSFEQMRNLIIELNLPKTVLDLFEGKCEIEPLKQDFTYPYKIIDTSICQKHYLVNRYKPFLADYYSDQIFAYDVITKKYITYSIELFNEDLKSWDSLFIGYIIALFEREKYSDNEIIEIGTLLGVKNVEIILEERIKYEEKELNYLESIEWRESLVKYIDQIENKE